MASQHHHLHTEKTPSSSQAITIATLIPVGGIFLILSGLTLTLTVVDLTAAFPHLLVFSPVLAPAAGSIGLALAGFFISGTMGVTAVAALSWVLWVIGMVFSVGNLQGARGKMAEAAGQVGHRTKEVRQWIRSRAHEVGRSST